jgi:CRISPR type III-A-associated RAMP protein Csm5
LANNQTAVKDFVKTAGRVYIPGSSLKGAILSGIVWRTILELFQKNPTFKRKTLVNGKVSWKEVGANDFIREALTGPMRYEEFNDFVFSYFSHDFKPNRFLQWMDVSDTSYASPEGSLEISLARVKGARRGGELPILYETIQPGSSFTGEISVKNLRLNEREVLETVHKFYVKVLECDNAPIGREPYLLRLGQGSTAFSTSLIIAAEELGIRNYRVKPPRTRKRIDENTPMAWVRICPQKGN